MHMNANIYVCTYITLTWVLQFYLFYYSRKQHAVICDKKGNAFNGNTEVCLPDTGCPKITSVMENGPFECL